GWGLPMSLLPAWIAATTAGGAPDGGEASPSLPIVAVGPAAGGVAASLPAPLVPTGLLPASTVPRWRWLRWRAPRPRRPWPPRCPNWAAPVTRLPGKGPGVPPALGSCASAVAAPPRVSTSTKL